MVFASPFTMKFYDLYNMFAFRHLEANFTEICEKISLTSFFRKMPYFGCVLRFNANISFTFQAIKNLSTHPTYLCFGPFCKLFGDFLRYLEINSFSERISKIYGNRKF